MKFPRRTREPVDINLAPLIDVVFILLLFFVVTTTFTRETQLKVDLPEAVTGAPPQAAESQVIEVLIGVDGLFSVNGLAPNSNNLAGLMQLMADQAKGDSSIPVLLSADANTPHQAVVTAMDAAAKLGMSKLRITTVEAASD